MIKYFLIIIGVYVIYYLLNFVYDLFLRKEKIIQTEQIEEFSLGDFADENNTITEIGIEDVENITTPNSFIRNDIQVAVQNENLEEPEIEELRRRFESEQDIDEEINEKINNSEDFLIDENILEIEEIEETEESEELDEDENNNQRNWEDLIKLSESSVELVANYDGQKVYHSIL